MGRHLLALFLGVAVGSCALSPARSGPFPTGDLVRIPYTVYWEFENLRLIEPEPIYQAWFVDLEACLEKTANYEEIYWYSASYGKSPDGYELDGVHYYPKGGEGESTIILIKRDKDTVKHEMAHSILRQNDVKGHHWQSKFWSCIKVKD